MLPHYQIYSNYNKFMTFDQFFDFYKNFSLFPDIINLIQLKNLFFTLAEVLNIEAAQMQKNKCILVNLIT
jgi:hypothetical protein